MSPHTLGTLVALVTGTFLLLLNNLPPTSALSCTTDKQCFPQICQRLICVPKKTIGGTCLEDRECASSVCESGVCVQCRSSFSCSADKYCEVTTHACTPRKVFGSRCAVDRDCASGMCDDTGGGLKTCVGCRSKENCTAIAGQFCDSSIHNCAALKVRGTSCAGDDECLDAKCAVVAGRKVCGQCKNDTQCVEGLVDVKFCDTATLSCLAKKSVNIQCTRDNECVSGVCLLNTNFGFKACGQCRSSETCSASTFCEPTSHNCATRLKFGEPCLPAIGPRMCASKICVVEALGTTRCVDCLGDEGCGSPFFCDGNKKCSPRKTSGESCVRDRECALNMCGIGLLGKFCVECRVDSQCVAPLVGPRYCALGSGKCFSKKGIGKPCAEDRECLKGFCGTTRKACEECRLDSHCPPLKVCKRGACTRKLSIGGNCTALGDKECLSGHCKLAKGVGKCVGCLVNQHCPALAKFCNVLKGKCVGCMVDEHCPGKFCNNATNIVAPACATLLERNEVCTRKGMCRSNSCILGPTQNHCL